MTVSHWQTGDYGYWCELDPKKTEYPASVPCPHCREHAIRLDERKKVEQECSSRLEETLACIRELLTAVSHAEQFGGPDSSATGSRDRAKIKNAAQKLLDKDNHNKEDNDKAG